MLKRFLRTAEAVSVLVFFFQALRVIFSVLFGIIYDQVFEESLTAWLPLSNLLVIAALLSPLLLTFRFRKHPPQRRFLAGYAIIAALARIALTINDPTVRFWSALVIISSAGIYLIGLLVLARAEAFAGLVAALAVEQILRAVGHTVDASLRPGWLPVQIAWAVVMVVLASWLRRHDGESEQPPAGFGFVGSLALGGWLFIELTLLSLPSAITRWSIGSYAIIAPALIGVTLLPLIPSIYHALWEARLAHWWRAAVALVLCGGLLAGYFGSGILASIALLAAQAAALIALLYMLDNAPPEYHPAGGNLGLGLLLFLILNFASAFAFTYPYTLPVMRGMGWAVYLAAGLFTGLGMILIAAPAGELDVPPIHSIPVALVSMAALIVVKLYSGPQPITPLPDTSTIRAGTYNIHYGYNDTWQLTLDEIVETIEESGADIVALQEVDTGRMTSYAADNAYYLARRLHMNVLYLPTVEHLTGIALLYRDPAVLTDSTLITSLQEQTGITHARLDVQGQALGAYGIWMGLSDEDTLTQINEALAFIGEDSPSLFGGDFNAVYDSPVGEAIRAAGFDDPFRLLGDASPPFTSPAPGASEQIDFVWVRGMQPVDAQVLSSEASDHYMVVIEFALP